MVLVQTTVLICFLRDKIEQFKLLSKTAASSQQTKQQFMDGLDKMWQEQLIDDLFRGRAENYHWSINEGNRQAESIKRLLSELDGGSGLISDGTDHLKTVSVTTEFVKIHSVLKNNAPIRKGEQRENVSEVSDRTGTFYWLQESDPVGGIESLSNSGLGLPAPTSSPLSAKRIAPLDITSRGDTIKTEQSILAHETLRVQAQSAPDVGFQEAKGEVEPDPSEIGISPQTIENDLERTVSLSNISTKHAKDADTKDADTRHVEDADTGNVENTHTRHVEARKEPPPKMVLVMTQSRHGSTWLMDMLGFREKSLPVFEPLNNLPFLKMYAYDRGIRAETLAAGYDPAVYPDWREVYLARICLCDWFGARVPAEPDRHYQAMMGLGYKAKRLGVDYKVQYKETMDKCSEEGTTMVPKTIRYYNLSTLHKIRQFGCDSFKVIHLVRDPRAVLNSRMNVFHELYDGNHYLGPHVNARSGQAGFNESYMEHAAAWTCSHHLHNYQLGLDPPAWLRGRYRMVRYEDLAADPLHWTRQLLDFVGFDLTAAYEEYVYNVTHLKDRGGRDRGWYGVERQTSEVPDLWRHTLLASHWRTIERVCAEMMQVFGYKPDLWNASES